MTIIVRKSVIPPLKVQPTNHGEQQSVEATEVGDVEESTMNQKGKKCGKNIPYKTRKRNLI